MNRNITHLDDVAALRLPISLGIHGFPALGELAQNLDPGGLNGAHHPLAPFHLRLPQGLHAIDGDVGRCKIRMHASIELVLLLSSSLRGVLVRAEGALSRLSIVVLDFSRMSPGEV